MRINFSRQEVLIMLLSIVTSLFAFSLSYAEENQAQAPIIIVKWETTITINAWERFTDEGVIAYDFQQWFITQYVTTTGTVNSNIPWVYKITYSVRDADFNYAPEMTRTITVIWEIAITTKPIIRSHNVWKLEWASVEVSFEVDQNTQAVIWYGLDGKYTMFSSPEKTFTKSSHTHTLENIEVWKEYTYLIYVRNALGLSAYIKWSFSTFSNTINNDIVTVNENINSLNWEIWLTNLKDWQNISLDQKLEFSSWEAKIIQWIIWIWNESDSKYYEVSSRLTPETTSYTIKNLPISWEVVVRLWYKTMTGEWEEIKYTFTMDGSSQEQEPILPVVQNTPGNIWFNSLKQNPFPEEMRNKFWCAGNYEGTKWMEFQNSWSRTWNVSNRSEFDNAIANMQPWERILIKAGTNLWNVSLDSSGTPGAKKYIMWSSSCNDTSWNYTLVWNNWFDITWNDWAIMNINFQPTGSTGIIYIKWSRNWIYNNRIDNAGEIRFTPQWTYSSPETIGNKVIGNYFNGSGNQSGITLLNPFTRKEGPSIFDLVVAGNTFEGFVESRHFLKAFTDVSYGFNHPYWTIHDIDGANTFTELSWNHYIDSHDELPTSKTGKWKIHDNFFEITDRFWWDGFPHISLRSWDNKLVYRNVFYDAWNRKSVWEGIRAHGKNHKGYYNVSYRRNNNGIGTTWATTESYTNYDAFIDKTFMRNEPLENNDWKYNFFLWDGESSAAWMRMTFISGYQKDIVPRNNTIKENFYSQDSVSDVWFQLQDYTDGSAWLWEKDWIVNNPNATRDLQYIWTRNGNSVDFRKNIQIPTSVTVKDFWLNGSDVVINMPEWVWKGSGKMIELID